MIILLKVNYPGDSPLIIACDNENESIVKFLIDNDSDIDAFDYTEIGRSVYDPYKISLVVAIYNKFFVKYLIEIGANAIATFFDNDYDDEYSYYHILPIIVVI